MITEEQFNKLFAKMAEQLSAQGINPSLFNMMNAAAQQGAVTLNEEVMLATYAQIRAGELAAMIASAQATAANIPAWQAELEQLTGE